MLHGCNFAILQHIFFGIFPLALISYHRFNFIPLFWVVDIVGSTNGDVWDAVAPSPTHLSQHIVHTFYEVNNVDAFVFKRRKVMEPMNDGIDKGEGASEELEGSQESDEGPQDNEKEHDSNDGEQGSDEETNSSSDGEDSSEYAQSASAIDSDDDIFDITGGITFFHLFYLHGCRYIFGIGY